MSVHVCWSNSVCSPAGYSAALHGRMEESEVLTVRDDDGRDIYKKNE